MFSLSVPVYVDAIEDDKALSIIRMEIDPCIGESFRRVQG